jgi:polyisoprenyl-teichoic acid--peptidoglycan teichoic acid transferase
MNNQTNPPPPWNDPNGPTQPVRPARPRPRPVPPLVLPPADPSDPLSHYQAIPYSDSKPARRGLSCGGGCGCALALAIALIIIGIAYLIFPARERILLLGIDRAPDGTAVSRSDTIILLQVNPLKPDVKMLSIPRDLWVPIPGVGENRINTAHFFAEANQPGSGPQAAMDTIALNFGITPSYYARIQFDGFKDVIDAMGGLDLILAQPQGGLEAGDHHLTGEQALAFARDRKGTDDFFRMNQGQLVVLTAVRQFLNPLYLPKLPAVLATASKAIDTNLPFWEWPRIGVALLRAGLDGVDHRTLTREMAVPFTTSGGAQVLDPQWDLIHPLISEMFGN